MVTAPKPDVELVVAQRDALASGIEQLASELPHIDRYFWSWRITQLLYESRRIVGSEIAGGGPPQSPARVTHTEVDPT